MRDRLVLEVLEALEHPLGPTQTQDMPVILLPVVPVGQGRVHPAMQVIRVRQVLPALLFALLFRVEQVEQVEQGVMLVEQVMLVEME
jgi:hypothetical protein